MLRVAWRQSAKILDKSDRTPMARCVRSLGFCRGARRRGGVG